MLDWAVPNVAAALGPTVTGIADLRQEAAGGGRQWLGGGSAVEGRGFVIMLDKFCSPASILGGASDSVHRQSGRCTRWRASCAFLCCAQRQVPTVLSFCRCLGDGTRLLFGGL